MQTPRADALSEAMLGIYGGSGGKRVSSRTLEIVCKTFFGDPAGPVGPKISHVFSFWGAVVVIHLGAGSGCRRHVSGTILRQIAMQAMAVRGIPHDARHLARLCQACAQGPQERPRYPCKARCLTARLGLPRACPESPQKASRPSA